jgi:hypothetical protein
MYDRSVAAINYFTDDEIDFVMHMYKGGSKQKDIATMLGTYPTRISRLMIAIGAETRGSWDYVTSPVDRLLNQCCPEPNSGCWLWTGAVNKLGYAHINVTNVGKRSHLAPAHRLSYILFKGDVPADLVIDHKCRTPSCVNPDHLEPVTQSENLRRSPLVCCDITGMCMSGRHRMTGDNIRDRGNGWRECKACQRERDAKRIKVRAAARLTARILKSMTLSVSGFVPDGQAW